MFKENLVEDELVSRRIEKVTTALTLSSNVGDYLAIGNQLWSKFCMPSTGEVHLSCVWKIGKKVTICC